MVFEKIGKYIYFKLETDRIVYLLSVNNVPGTTLRMGTTSDRLAYRLAFSAASAVEDISTMRFNQSDDGSCHLHSACRTLPCLLCSLLLLRLSRSQGVISDVPDLTVHVLVWPHMSSTSAGTLSQPYRCYRPGAIFTSLVYFESIWS